MPANTVNVVEADHSAMARARREGQLDRLRLWALPDGWLIRVGGAAGEVLIWVTKSAVGRRGLAGFAIRHQAGLFFPLLTLLGIDLKISSIKAQ